MNYISRWFGFFGLLALMMVFCPGCDDGGDDPDQPPAEISGDAALTIENPWEDRFTVYFDGVFIGRVQPNSAKTWSVPSGNHTILVDNGDRDWTEPFQGAYYFAPGLALILTIDQSIDSNPVLYVI
jgi:hypothetical protein